MKREDLKQIIKECINELSFKSAGQPSGHNFDVNKFENVVMGSVDPHDYPDFSDAYIESAMYNGRELTEQELEIVNNDGSIVNQLANDKFLDISASQADANR